MHRFVVRGFRSSSIFKGSPPTSWSLISSFPAPEPAFSHCLGPKSLFQRHQDHPRFSSSSSSPSKMATTEATLRNFFQSPKFAVVGASTNPDKYGYKVFKWYIAHSLPVTPINPSGAPINVDGTDYPVVKSLSEVEDPEGTSVSFITPPAVTLKSLQQAKELGFPSVFLQPGTFNDEVIGFARENFKAVVAGTEGDTWGAEGWCVLVDGERGLKAVGKL